MEINKRNYKKVLREIKLEEHLTLSQILLEIRQKIIDKKVLSYREEFIAFNHLKKYFEDFSKEETKYILKNANFKGFEARPLLSFQETGTNFLLERTGAILADDTGCIEGNQIVHMNLGGNHHFKCTIKELYNKFNNLIPQSKIWSERKYFASTLSETDNRFYLREVERVLYNGKKPIWKLVLEDGKEIKCTSDHKFNNNGIWKSLHDLKIGDEIFTNGIEKCIKCDSTENLIKYKYAKFVGYCTKCVYTFFRKNKWNAELGSETLENGYIMIKGFIKNHLKKRPIPKHRLVYEAFLNNYSYTEYLEVIKNNSFKENHIFLKPEQIIHHKDNNPLNNELENLELTTVENHVKIHKARKNIKRVLPKSVKILNIINLNYEDDVYDLTVKETHNYIVNGIVVHNCGKSIQSIAAALLLPEDYKILIVTLRSLKYNFENEIKFYTDSVNVIDKKWISGAKFTIVHYEALKKWFNEIKKEKFHVFIADEATAIKNKDSVRADNFKKLAKDVKRVWLLTGTPMTNRPYDYFNLLKIIKHDVAKNWQNYVTTYCDGKLNDFGHWDTSGASNLELLYNNTKSSVLRRLKTDYLLDLPNKYRNEIFLHLFNTKGYDKVIDDWKLKKQAEILEEFDKTLDVDDIDINEMTKIILWRQFCALEKIEDGSLFDFIDSKFDENPDNKIVFFTNFTKVVDSVYDKYKSKAVFIDGRIKDPKERLKIVEEFNRNPSQKIMILNMAVGSMGLNIQSANIGIINDFNWVPAVMLQCEDRLWRMGQKRTVDIFYPLYKDTFEEIMYRVINNKMKNISIAIEGHEEEYFTGEKKVEKGIFSELISELKTLRK